MLSYKTLTCLIPFLCFAGYVRYLNYRNSITRPKEKKPPVSEEQHRFRHELTYEYSEYHSDYSIPSFTSGYFSEIEDTNYDATYSISSDMPFSIPGKSITEKEPNPQEAFEAMFESFREKYKNLDFYNFIAKKLEIFNNK